MSLAEVVRSWLLAPVLEQAARFHTEEMASLGAISAQLDRIEALVTPEPAGAAVVLRINVGAITEQEDPDGAAAHEHAEGGSFPHGL